MEKKNIMDIKPNDKLKHLFNFRQCNYSAKTNLPIKIDNPPQHIEDSEHWKKIGKKRKE